MTAVRQLLADRYRLDEQIAVGGMGQVWRATDTVLDRTVAVKTLKPEYVGDDEFRERFRAEARAAGGLSHPGIASVYDFGEAPDGAWLVMELVDGEPLSTLLRRERTLPADRVLDVVAQTARALQAAHDGGVVHRDVKPGNLLVTPDGVVKVTDFGIASAAGAVPLTRTGQVVGTASYVSPEQARGAGAGPRSDLYSLGVVAYEALAGVRPFPGDHPVAVVLAHLQEPPPALPAGVPAPVAALVLALLAKDPADRPLSAAELADRATDLRQDGRADALLPVAPPPAARAAGASALTSGLTTPTATGLLPVARMRRRPSIQAPGAVPATPASAPGATPRGQRRALRAITVALGLLALALGLRSTTSEPAGSSARTAPSAAASSAPSAARPVSAQITIVAAALVGRTASAASQLLRGQGLVPRLVADGQGSPVGTVAGVEPAGPVDPGSVVVLHVVPQPPAAQGPSTAVAPAAPGAPVDGDRGRGKGADGKGEGPK